MKRLITEENRPDAGLQHMVTVPLSSSNRRTLTREMEDSCLTMIFMVQVVQVVAKSTYI